MSSRKLRSNYPGSRELGPSIKYLNDGEVLVHNFHTPEKVCWFKIHPPFSLSKGQLYAYEKYLEKIAEAISSWHFRTLGDVKEVYSVIEIVGSGSTFRMKGIAAA